jgi:type II secretory pathway component GspD/PulD (secretin)
LDLVTEQSSTKWTVKKDSVEIVPKTTQTETLILRSWTVSPSLFSNNGPKVDAQLSSTSGIGSLMNDPASAPKPSGSRRPNAKEFLSGQNVSFAAPNSTATYNTNTKTLTVFNTAEMLELVDQLVNDADQSQPQFDITARFVEFTQQNSKELSFDWLLGQSNIPGNGNVFYGGALPVHSVLPSTRPTILS